MLTHKPTQLLVIALVTVVTAVMILLDINIPLVRPLLTLFLVLAVGHTTLLAWANHLMLRGGVRALMTIILGITLFMISGFVLNFTAWGLEMRSWVFLISAIILFNSIVALLRKQSTSENVAPTSIQSWRLDLHVGQIVVLALAVVIAGASLMIARNGAMNQSTTRYSQLWMLPDTTANSTQAVLGIRNEEQQSFSYRLVVMQGATLIQEFPTIDLAPNETWQGKVDLTGLTAASSPVEAVLYRGDEQTEPYRTASLWLQ